MWHLIVYILFYSFRHFLDQGSFLLKKNSFSRSNRCHLEQVFFPLDFNEQVKKMCKKTSQKCMIKSLKYASSIRYFINIGGIFRRYFADICRIFGRCSGPMCTMVWIFRDSRLIFVGMLDIGRIWGEYVENIWKIFWKCLEDMWSIFWRYSKKVSAIFDG